MKYIVTGGDGMLASYFSKDSRFVCLSKDEFDVTNSSQMEKVIKEINPEYIIHAAALTNVDYCQSHHAEAYEINSLSCYYLAKLSQKFHFGLVYVSTGAVFAGKTKKYNLPDSPISPVNTYARTKFMGELFVQDIANSWCIVRTGWLFGGFEKDNKFVGKILQQLLIEEKEQLTIVSNTLGCPTYAGDLAEQIKDLIKSRLKNSIFHFVNQGTATRPMMATEIIHFTNSAAQLNVVSSFATDTYTSPRPKYEIIKSSFKTRNWKDALGEYVKEYTCLK